MHLRVCVDWLAPRAGQQSSIPLVFVFWGVGEVLGRTEDHVLVDFRGTGQLGVHQEALEPQYVLPIPDDRVGLI